MAQLTRIPKPVAAAMIGVLSLAGASAVMASQHGAATDASSPLTGHAEVVGTWLVDFQDVEYWWNVVEYQVDDAGTALTPAGPTFLVGDGDHATVVTGSDVRVRLGEGEAVFRRPAQETNVYSLGADPATLLSLWLSTEPTDTSGNKFTPGAGTHDIDIVRDVVAAGEVLTLRADIPAFVLVTEGWVTDAAGTRIDAGGWATLSGDIALTNGGEQPAVVLAALVGPAVELPTTPTTTAAAPTTAAPAATNQPAPPTTLPAAPSTDQPPPPSTDLATPPSTAPAAVETTTTWVAPEATEPAPETSEWATTTTTAWVPETTEWTATEENETLERPEWTPPSSEPTSA